jgi:Mg-chelatase subunit ChlD
MISQGGTTCPDCRATLANLPNLPPPPRRRTQRTSFSGHVFNALSGFITGNTLGEDNAAAISTQTGIAAPGYEDPLLPVPASTEMTENEEQRPEITISVTNTPERKKISTAEHPLFYASVELQYCNNSTKKTPLDVMCILDVSGSMGGEKIESLKKAVQFVISTLGDQDRLSIVEFNSRATPVHGLARMTESNKAEASRLVNRLHAGGGTNIFHGMDVGWQILSDRRQINGSTSIFLLTDGQDSSSESYCTRLASTMKEAGCSLMVFGFGADHDSRLMSAIANAGEGDFTYVDTPDTVIDAFGGAIGSQQGASIRDVQVQVNRENEVKIKEVNSGIYKSEISSDKTRSTTTYRQLYPGEKRTMLLKLHIPAVQRGGILGLGSAMEIAEQIIFNTAITYSNESTMIHKEPVTCIVSRVNEGFDDAKDLIVDSQINRCISTETTLEAMKKADSGNFEAAKTLIRDVLSQIRASSSFAARNPMVLSCVEDLEEALTAVSNRSEYMRGGRAEMSEAYGKGSAQRSCYTKRGKSSYYQSPTSMTLQSSAVSSKSHIIEKKSKK